MYDGCETEHLGIHFQGRDGSGGDDDRGEAVEDGFDGDGSIEAGEVENGIRDGRGGGFEGFEDEEEAFVVSCDQGCKGGNLLEWLVVFYVSELEGSDKRSETLGTESELALAASACHLCLEVPQRFLLDKGKVFKML